MALRKPRTLETAQAYIGTTFQKWWEATDSPEGWYPATVASVSNDIVEDDSGSQYKGLWLLVR